MTNNPMNRLIASFAAGNFDVTAEEIFAPPTFEELQIHYGNCFLDVESCPQCVELEKRLICKCGETLQAHNRQGTAYNSFVRVKDQRH